MDIKDKIRVLVTDQIDKLRAEEFTCIESIEVRDKMIKEFEAFLEKLPTIKVFDNSTFPHMPS